MVPGYARIIPGAVHAHWTGHDTGLSMLSTIRLGPGFHGPKPLPLPNCDLGEEFRASDQKCQGTRELGAFGALVRLAQIVEYRVGQSKEPSGSSKHAILLVGKLTLRSQVLPYRTFLDKTKVLLPNKSSHKFNGPGYN
ncbi:hypothetical protein RRG08_035715 [Elysia crispata]|uniref:Uncharacterized protein n=1 Tax=Elysia crispata TaxID=231223 RepID=A0AAE0YIU5_9GAST|nr:hypothetical protein RRG08_035715 [Elysia crispata]